MSDTQFGHFDDAAKEYVITNPATPWPWINYLGNDGFFSLVSQTAGGYCFFKDAKFRRILRYRYNGVPMDAGGRYFYINDGSCVWSPYGSLYARRWTSTNAGTAWATQGYARRKTAWVPN